MSSQQTKQRSTGEQQPQQEAAPELRDQDLDEVAGGASCVPPIKLPQPEPLPRPPFPDPEDPFDDRQISPPDDR